MNLNRYHPQDSRQATVILKEVEATCCDFELACEDTTTVVVASETRLNQVMCLQVKQVSDDGVFITFLLNFLPGIMSGAGICISQYLKNFTLQISIKFHLCSSLLKQEVSYA